MLIIVRLPRSMRTSAAGRDRLMPAGHAGRLAAHARERHEQALQRAHSDLSRNLRAAGEHARRPGRIRVTHRDADDFYLTAADRAEERDEDLLTAARTFAALPRSPAGTRAVTSAVAGVFPWARHPPDTERSHFAAELTAALSDAPEPGTDTTAREVIAGWRATARIKAGKRLYEQALAPTKGDFGPMEAIT